VNIQYLKTHAWYLAVISIALVAGRSWIQEHDARLLAEQTARVAEQKFQDYQKQVDALNAVRDSRIAAIQKQAAAVKTPAQAITAIPDVSTLPLHATPVPTAPEAVQVDALALYQTLSACQVDRVKLDACTQSSSIKDEQITAQRSTISELKRPKGFWKRLGSNLKWIGTAAGIGFALGRGI
jgi:hypothetical protein